MKVITQLIRHFWQRGALTQSEAAYLLRHGFCRERDIPGFKAAADIGSTDIDIPHVAEPVHKPDRLDHVEAALIRRRPARRTGRQPRAKELPEKELIARLNDAYAAREHDLRSVLALGRRLDEVQSWPEAASRCHSTDPEEFHVALRAGLRDRSVLIGDLWQASDPEPFHRLMDAEDFRGRAARAFQAVLIGAGSAALGQYIWILKHDEIQALVNLTVIHHRLLESLRRLYDDDRLLLSHSLEQNHDPAQVWALVILFNAYRDPQRGDAPDYGQEYGPVALPRYDVWKQAWTSALRMDRKAVTEFLAACYQGVRGVDVEDAVDCRRPLMCPVAWNLPNDDQ